MRGNKVNWISELASLKQIQELDFEGNLIDEINQVSAFDAHPTLQVLNVSKNPVCMYGFYLL